MTTNTTRLLTALRQTGDALNDLRQPWALVGGLAISIRVEPRFTRDIDIAVAVPDDVSAEGLVTDLTSRGFAVQLSLEQQALGRLASVRLLPPGEPAEGVVIDLLFMSSGIEDEICQEAERLEVVPGLLIAVAQAGHLVAMKLLARAGDRPQDELDLQMLLSRLSQRERDRAIAAVARIERRGANRDKALSEELNTLLQRLPR